MARSGICQKCDKYQLHMDAHRRLRHQSTCAVRIPGSSIYELVHRTEQDGRFHCPGCDSSYPSPPGLQAHVRSGCKNFMGHVSLKKHVCASAPSGSASSRDTPYDTRARTLRSKPGHLPTNVGQNPTRATAPSAVDKRDNDTAENEREDRSYITRHKRESSSAERAHRRGKERAGTTALILAPSSYESGETTINRDQLPAQTLYSFESDDEDVCHTLRSAESRAYQSSSKTVQNRGVVKRQQPIPASSVAPSASRASESKVFSTNAASRRMPSTASTRPAAPNSTILFRGPLSQNEVSAVWTFLSDLTRDLSEELTPAFEAFGCRTARDLDALCAMDSDEEWAVLHGYLQKHHEVDFLHWLIVKAGLETRRAALPAEPPAVNANGSANAICAWLNGLKRPLVRHAPLFYDCGLRDVGDLDALCKLEVQWDGAVKQEMLRKGLTPMEWLVVRDGLKARVADVKVRR